MMVIGLAPLVLITVIVPLIAPMAALSLGLPLLIMIATNAVGASGDVYIAWRLVECRVRHGSGQVTDTGDGFIYASAEVPSGV
ncbi:MAG: DUF3267 domain-containing protein [Propionibacteriaceae bacterium]